MRVGQMRMMIIYLLIQSMLGIIPHLHYFCPFGVIVVGFLIQISAHVFSCFMVSYCNVAI